jgi:hypothetical protein
MCVLCHAIRSVKSRIPGSWHTYLAGNPVTHSTYAKNLPNLPNLPNLSNLPNLPNLSNLPNLPNLSPIFAAVLTKQF